MVVATVSGELNHGKAVGGQIMGKRFMKKCQAMKK